MFLVFLNKVLFVFRLCKEIAVELIDEVLKQECYHSVIEFYDDLIAKHREKVDLYHVASNLFAQLEIEAVKEATEDIWIGCLCGEACSSLVHDVLMEELSTVAEEVLMHYGVRLALSQFKQISKVGFMSFYRLIAVILQVSTITQCAVQVFAPNFCLLQIMLM